MNRVVYCRRPRPRVAADGGSEKEERADLQQEEAVGEATDIVMTDTKTATTAATETETDVGALATIDYSDPSQLHKVIRVGH